MAVSAPVPFSLRGKTLFVAGHRGLVGSALLRACAARGISVLTADRAQVDLRDGAAVDAFLMREKPAAVICAAGTVGGILANQKRPVDFLYDNVLIATSVLHAAAKAGVEKLLYLGSSCIYPRMAPQPMVETALLSGPLEPTNQWYAMAKLAGIKLAEAYRQQGGHDFISALPCNLYGPGDNFNLETSHVLPALLARLHHAKATGQQELTMWGTGKARREFLYVDDLAEACLFLLEHYSDALPMNVGSGQDHTILELAEQAAAIVGFRGRFAHDLSKPDGMPQKLLDVSRLSALGFRARTSLTEGLQKTYAWYEQNLARAA